MVAALLEVVKLPLESGFTNEGMAPRLGLVMELSFCVEGGYSAGGKFQLVLGDVAPPAARHVWRIDCRTWEIPEIREGNQPVGAQDRAPIRGDELRGVTRGPRAIFVLLNRDRSRCSIHRGDDFSSHVQRRRGAACESAEVARNRPRA